MKQKGFTLIELLAVIIILAVIALIATPIVLNVVDKARTKADLQSVNGILDAAKLYYTEAMIDTDMKTKVDNVSNIYKDVKLHGSVPVEGKLYVNNNGQTAVSVILNKKCYIKNFNTEVEIKEDITNCDLGFVGKDEVSPTIEFHYSGNIGQNGWYISDTYINIKVNDNQSGPKALKYCQTIEETCVPKSNSIIYSAEYSPVIMESEGSKICVIGYDNYENESILSCSNQVKVDKTDPILIQTDPNTTIVIGESKKLPEDYFDIKNNGFSIITNSSCFNIETNENILDTSKLLEGETIISCVVEKENGRIATSNIVITVLPKYTGIPDIDYNPGQIVYYADLAWKVMFNNKDTVTLILAGDYLVSSYGTNSIWDTSLAHQKVTVDFVNTYSKIKQDIIDGGIVYDSFSKSYVRLPKFEEASTNISNNSNNYFWTMSPSGNLQRFLSPNGTTTIAGYSCVHKTGYQGTSGTIDYLNKKPMNCTNPNNSPASNPNSTTVEIITSVDYDRATYHSTSYSQAFETGYHAICASSGVQSINVQKGLYYANPNSCTYMNEYSIKNWKLADVSLRPVITVKKK